MSKNDLKESQFWADATAREMIAFWKSEKFNIESGITPSGTIHIGNFREVITQDLIRRALEDMGYEVEFFYVWDDYDRFRKVPANMPKQDMLREHLGKPVSEVPDPTGEHESYARFNEALFEEELARVGIPVTYVYQAEEYAKGTYAERIREAFQATAKIKAILNEFREEPLQDWWPGQVYSRWTGTDETRITKYDGYTVTYTCTKSGNSETIDFRKDPRVKLRWRVDWPMRWAHKQIHFEAAGKDHHSAGSSYDTGKRIVKQVWNRDPPLSVTYNFVTPKGMGGKISSSAGNAITISDVLEVYTPEVLRYLFAGSRPNAEFSIPFDDNVLKVYEDFDATERAYYEGGDEQLVRVYEMSVRSRDDLQEQQPVQPSFRQLVMLSQVYGDDAHILEHFEPQTDFDRNRIVERAACAKRWARTYAPQGWQFTRNTEVPEAFAPDEAQRAVFSGILQLLEAGADEEELGEKMSALMSEHDVKPRDFFRQAYVLLLSNTKGPRLAPYLVREKERAVKLLGSI